MTERLYYTDSYLAEFDATVAHVAPHGTHLFLKLDRTAFYPTSGGQPFDTGTLNGARVIDVIEREDGEVAHVVEGNLTVGETARGRIDWRRRFDHMQQHSGQHVLSAAFDRLHKARTVSFHLGSKASTIDLERDLSAELIAAAEAEANRIVCQDRPISIRFVDAEETARLQLRKEPTRGGRLRLVEVEAFDRSACGGTHVSRTGAIGMIAVSANERFKGGTRVTFVCGGRALAVFHSQRDALAASVRLLSVLPEGLPGAIAKAQTEAKDLKRAVRALNERLATYVAMELVTRAERVGDTAVVVQALDGYDAAQLKSLAGALVSIPGHAVALISTSSPVLVVVARSQDVAIDASTILRALTTRFGGRDGGKPDLAQGGGLTGSLPEILELARQQFRAAFI